jgi:hypothetical protein
VTRRRKCPRWADIIAGKVRYRRQPKGRRAKSGQWAKRTPCPVKLGPAVCETMRVHGWNHAWGVDYADPNHEGVSEADRASIERLMMRRSNKP